MMFQKVLKIFWLVSFILSFAFPSAAQKKGLASIKADDMKFHVKFLSADQFRGRVLDQETVFNRTPSSPLFQIDIRHEIAAAILGVSVEKLDQLFETIRQGRQPESIDLAGKKLDINPEITTRGKHNMEFNWRQVSGSR